MKLQKKNHRPKQLRHWIYRLSGKSNGKAATVTDDKLYLYRREQLTYYYFPYNDVYVDLTFLVVGAGYVEFFIISPYDKTLHSFRFTNISFFHEFKKLLDDELDKMHMELL